MDNSNSSAKPLPMAMTIVKSEPNYDINDVELESSYNGTVVKQEPSWDITDLEPERNSDGTVVKSEPNCDITDVELAPSNDGTVVKSEPSWDITDLEPEPSYDETVVKSEPSCDITDVELEPSSESELENNYMEYSNVTNENPIASVDDDFSNKSSKLKNKMNKSKLKIKTKKKMKKTKTPATVKPTIIECSKCKKQFPYLSALKRHTRACQTVEEIIFCGLCDFECDAKNKLSVHLDDHMKDEILSCKKCDYNAVDSADYLCHRYVHQTTDYGKRLYCWRCDNKFLNVERLEFHIRSKYLKKVPGLCKVCLKEFSRIKNLRAHICIEAGIKPYKCDECDKSFWAKRSFTRHMNCHMEKKFVCDTCEIAFRLKSELTRHRLRMHDTRIPVTCDHCEKLFKNKRTLHNHILWVARNKELICSIMRENI